MRVLLTCEDYFPHLGGAEVCIFNLRKQLMRMGHVVTVFTNTMLQSNDEDRVIRLAWKFSPAQLFRTWRVLWKVIEEQDIVHCTYSFRIATLAVIICRLRRKPMLLTQQGRGIVPEAKPKFADRLLFRVCQEVSMRCAHHITSTSDEITDLTAAFVPRSKITLVSNGYDAERFKPNPLLPFPQEFASIPRTKKRILSVRRLVPKNGIHVFIQALALVKLQSTDFHYFAIGEGRSQQYISQLIREKGLEHHVTLLGKRENDELTAYYQHADLIVIPSSAEARSIACIEAMGMEKPIIASRVGGLIDLLGKDSRFGQLVSIYDSEACTYDPPDVLPDDRLQPLVDAVLNFLQNPLSFQQKAIAARMMVKREYSWDAIITQYLQLYYQLLGH